MRKRSRVPAGGLLGESRVRILDELCGQPQTAAEIATKVGTSANAVRVHLDGLRDAGLVQFNVERRGVGKPTHVYAITETAEFLLSAAYAPVLEVFFELIAAKLKEETPAFLHDAGVRLAAYEADVTQRTATIRDAIPTLESLGRPAHVRKRGNVQAIETQCCALAAVSRKTPNACLMVEALLSKATGLSVRQECERGEHPRCRFVLA